MSEVALNTGLVEYQENPSKLFSKLFLRLIDAWITHL